MRRHTVADRNPGEIAPGNPIHDNSVAFAAAENALEAFRSETVGNPGRFPMIGFQTLNNNTTDAPDKITKDITIDDTKGRVDSKLFQDPQTPVEFDKKGFVNEHVSRTDVQLSNNVITSNTVTDRTGPKRTTHEDASYVFAPDGRRSDHFVSSEDAGNQHAESSGNIFINADGTELFSSSGKTNTGVVLKEYGQRNPDGTGFFNTTTDTIYAGTPTLYSNTETCTRTDGNLACTTNETLTVAGKPPFSKSSALAAHDFNANFPNIDTPPPVIPLPTTTETSGSPRRHRKGNG
jgi:hypothetical protein